MGKNPKKKEKSGKNPEINRAALIYQMVPGQLSYASTGTTSFVISRTSSRVILSDFAINSIDTPLA